MMRKYRSSTLYQTLLGRLNKYDDRAGITDEVLVNASTTAEKSEQNRPLGRSRCR
jgi:hypothetical protein